MPEKKNPLYIIDKAFLFNFLTIYRFFFFKMLSEKLR